MSCPFADCLPLFARLIVRQPKYWCKHCSTYVKDTKFERTQHEATGRHQGNLKRFLRGIQNGHEKDEREKQRAKSEVERLNRAVGGVSVSSSQDNAQSSKKTPSSSASQPTIADRKRQMAQLAEMGVAVPNEFRGQMAMAGEWQVLSQRSLDMGQPAEGESSLSIGVRKRKFEGQEEEEEAGEIVRKKGWGSTTKEYPSDAQKDLDALLAGNILVKREKDVPALKRQDPAQLRTKEPVCNDAQIGHDISEVTDKVHVKHEDASGLSELSDQVPEQTEAASPKALEVVFKKWKSKSARQN